MSPKPYPDDPTYLHDEVQWLTLRCTRLALLRSIRASREGVDVVADDPERGAKPEQKKHLAALREAEDTLRRRIDERLAINRQDGPALRLDTLCNRFDLDCVERQVLLLVTVPALGVELAEPLGGVGGFGFAISSITPEIVGAFLELDLNGLLVLRDVLGESGTLVKHGLVEVEPVGRNNRVQDFVAWGLFVTEMAFDIITGRAPSDDRHSCPTCGSPT
ncbi:MAG: hypothetical protein AMXMBFR64_39410 [Myxococcales bacterium]